MTRIFLSINFVYFEKRMFYKNIIGFFGSENILYLKIMQAYLVPILRGSI